jgi:hypothetical protein
VAGDDLLLGHRQLRRRERVAAARRAAARRWARAQIWALSEQGRSLVSLGQVDEGMALLDEAVAAATARRSAARPAGCCLASARTTTSFGFEKECTMYVIREVLHRKPGKVRQMVDKFKTISNVVEEIDDFFALEGFIASSGDGYCRPQNAFRLLIS